MSPTTPKHSKKTHIGNHLLHPETQMMNYGFDPALSEGAVKPPVFLTSTFVFRTAEEGRDFFDVVSGRKYQATSGTGQFRHAELDTGLRGPDLGVGISVPP